MSFDMLLVWTCCASLALLCHPLAAADLAANSSDLLDEGDEEPVIIYPRCFRFTWPGPFQYKKQISDFSCEDLREDYTNVPCRYPIAPTDNDREPDMRSLWLKFKDQPNAFDCPMLPGQACVKYVYKFNGGVQNITYMCAKVNSSDGCYRQKYISGLEVNLCVCHSQMFMMPCNMAGMAVGGQREKVILWTLALMSLRGAHSWWSWFF